MLHGDWGFSFSSRINVDRLILQRVPTTLFVVGSSQLLALAVALSVGVYAAMRPYSIFDQIANTVAFVGFSLPTFFAGLLLILIFSVNLAANPLREVRRPPGFGPGLDQQWSAMPVVLPDVSDGAPGHYSPLVKA
jgi:ABC-type dipeptide/oligopeptide/nickel transport system permease component